MIIIVKVSANPQYYFKLLSLTSYESVLLTVQYCHTSMMSCSTVWILHLPIFENESQNACEGWVSMTTDCYGSCLVHPAACSTCQLALTFTKVYPVDVPPTALSCIHLEHNSKIVQLHIENLKDWLHVIHAQQRNSDKHHLKAWTPIYCIPNSFFSTFNVTSNVISTICITSRIW